MPEAFRCARYSYLPNARDLACAVTVVLPNLRNVVRCGYLPITKGVANRRFGLHQCAASLSQIAPAQIIARPLNHFCVFFLPQRFPKSRKVVFAEITTCSSAPWAGCERSVYLEVDLYLTIPSRYTPICYRGTRRG
jgi:hypothetical protein